MPGKVSVINASPLILLGKLRHLQLLQALIQDLRVPAAVFSEIKAGEGKDHSVHATLSWAEHKVVEDIPVPQAIMAWDIGAGESQVIAHCLMGNYRAILDDNKARACASSFSIPIIGTLGIIMRAKQQGLIPQARPLIENLCNSGSFLSDKLIQEVLHKLGE